MKISLSIPSSTAETTPVQPSIRFPVFPIKATEGPWCRDRKSFEDHYEKSSTSCAPDFWILHSSCSNYKEYRKSPMMRMLPGDSWFWDLIRTSGFGTIYFIDPHFEDKSFRRLYELAQELETAYPHIQRELMIVTSDGDDAEEIKRSFKDKLPVMRGWSYVTMVYNVLPGDVGELIHDRFVMLDGCIWHFGSSASAMHELLTAYSGPWVDQNGAFNALMSQFVNKGTSFYSKES